MPRSPLKRIEAALRRYALSFPDATEHFPWGDRAIKVRGKVFVFMGWDKQGFGLSVKLPASHLAALNFPFAKPTGYGLSRTGWVSAEFGPRDRVPIEMLRDWIEESYRAVAPKTVVKRL